MKRLDEDQELQLCLERDRLLSDMEFKRSPTMSKLLRYLVDHRLSAYPVPLKAYSIAVDALGRDKDFDSETDSYPRVQISRLRKILDNFYLREGGENRLSIPLNNYEILITPNRTVAATEQQSDRSNLINITTPADDPDPGHPSLAKRIARFHRRGSSRIKAGITIAAATLSLALVACYFLFLRPTPAEIAYPSVIVADARGTINETTRIDAAISKAYIVNSLAKFDQLQVESNHLADHNDDLYILGIDFPNDTGELIQLELIDNDSGRLLWSQRITSADREQLEAELARVVISIAGPNGVLNQAEIAKYRNDFSPGYPCILQFRQFTRYPDVTVVDSVRECLLESVRRFPDDSYLLSILSIANSVALRFGSDVEMGTPNMEMARRAVQLDSNSSLANMAVAQVAFFENDCETGVTWGKRATALNPLNSRITGYLGLNMLGCKLPEGEKFAARALKMDPNADPMFAGVLAFYKLRNSDAFGSHQLSIKYMAETLRPEPSLEMTYILSSAMLGDKSEARNMWRIHAARFGFPEDTPVRRVLGSWIANKNLIDEIAVFFDKMQLF